MNESNGRPGWTDYGEEVEPLDVPEGTPDPDRERAAVRELMRPYLLEQARDELRAAGEGLATGYDALERWGLRWRPGKLYAVVGRPSEGKTTVLLDLLMRHVDARAEGRAPDDRAPAVFVTYEENRHDLYLRLLLREVYRLARENAGGAGHPFTLNAHRKDVEEWLKSGAVRPGATAAAEADLIAEAAARLDAHAAAGRLLLLDGDTRGGDVYALMRNLHRAALDIGRPFSLVVVDYFQKIRPPLELRGATRQVQLQEVADVLRRFAKGKPPALEGEEEEEGPEVTEYATPVVVGAQVNRDSTRATDGSTMQPALHQIREADDLANDAAGVLTLHRPPEEEENGKKRDGKVINVQVVKNRDGARGGEFGLDFAGEFNHLTERLEGAALLLARLTATEPSAWD